MDVKYTVSCTPCNLPIDGNLSTIDPELAAWIHSEINKGNEWVWCDITVTAECDGFKGYDSLCGCSYKSEAAFTRLGEDGYYGDMKRNSLQSLREVLQTKVAEGLHAKDLLENL